MNISNKKRFSIHMAIAALSITIGHITNTMDQQQELQQERQYLASRNIGSKVTKKVRQDSRSSTSSSSSSIMGSNVSSDCRNGLCTICINGNCFREAGNSVSTSSSCTSEGCEINVCIDGKCHQFNA